MLCSSSSGARHINRQRFTHVAPKSDSGDAKNMRRSSLLFWFATCLSSSIWAQSTPNATTASAVVPNTSQSDEITLLRQEIAAQQRQIQHEQDEINELRSEIAPARTKSTRANDGPSPAEVPSQALTGPPVLAARTFLSSAPSATTSKHGP